MRYLMVLGKNAANWWKYTESVSLWQTWQYDPINKGLFIQTISSFLFFIKFVYVLNIFACWCIGSIVMIISSVGVMKATSLKKKEEVMYNTNHNTIPEEVVIIIIIV